MLCWQHLIEYFGIVIDSNLGWLTGQKL